MNQLVVMMFLTTISLSSVAQNQYKPDGKLNFTRFSVKADQKRVAIDWATDNTKPTNYFEVQKSDDGINFKTIMLVLGPDPRQDGDTYGCFDKSTRKNSRHTYYRLRHISLNGDDQFSETKLLAKS